LRLWEEGAESVVDLWPYTLFSFSDEELLPILEPRDWQAVLIWRVKDFEGAKREEKIVIVKLVKSKADERLLSYARPICEKVTSVSRFNWGFLTKW
jgi:hypothetical protein